MTVGVMVGDGSERWHGTTGGVSNHKCGCDQCARAWRAARNPYLRRWRAERRNAGLNARGKLRAELR